MDCDAIDVNSAPDESAKESSYFICMEVTYKCRLLGLSLLLALANFAHMKWSRKCDCYIGYKALKPAESQGYRHFLQLH